MFRSIKQSALMMKSDSNLISLIENFPVPASLKESDAGRYVINNVHNLRQFGVGDWRDIAGLKIQDIAFPKTELGRRYARSVEALDVATREAKSPFTRRSRFVDYCGNVQMDEMTKFPIFGSNGNVIGIVTYRRDVTRTLPPIRIYQLHRYFHPVAEAIKRSLVFFGVETHFLFPPTEAQIRTFLLRSELYSNKEIARFMGVSDRTVECHCAALRNKIVGGDLANVILILKRNISCDENSTQY